MPPSLVIVILNGCFSFPIGSYLFSKLHCLKNQTDDLITDEEMTLTGDEAEKSIADQAGDTSTTNNKMSPVCAWILTSMETIAFFMQIVMLIMIPVLLVSIYTNKYRLVAVLIPITLIVLSIVWSGWITVWFQKITMPEKVKPQDDEMRIDYSKMKNNDDRLKAGISIFLTSLTHACSGHRKRQKFGVTKVWRILQI